MNSIKISLNILIFIFGVPVLLYAQGNGVDSGKTKGKPWNELTPYEQAVKSSRVKGARKINITQTAHKGGIQSGCVIAYGHFIRTPFVASYVDHKLMINGVQVEPSLVLEQEQKMAKPVDEKRLVAARRQIAVSQEIREKYRKEKPLKAEPQLKADMIAFAKTRDVVLDAKWEDNAFLVSFLYGTGFELFTLNIPEKPVGGKARAKSELKKDGEDRRIQYIHGALKSGWCLVFNSSNGLQSIQDPREAVNKIMNNAALSKQEKVEAMGNAVFMGSYEDSFDVLENYDPKEWARD